jgi:hypothetical protein
MPMLRKYFIMYLSTCTWMHPSHAHINKDSASLISTSQDYAKCLGFVPPALAQRVPHARYRQNCGLDSSCHWPKTAKRQTPSAVRATGLRCVPPCKDDTPRAGTTPSPLGGPMPGHRHRWVVSIPSPLGDSRDATGKARWHAKRQLADPLLAVVPQPSTILPHLLPSVGHAQTPSDVSCYMARRVLA